MTNNNNKENRLEQLALEIGQLEQVFLNPQPINQPEMTEALNSFYRDLVLDDPACIYLDDPIQIVQAAAILRHQEMAVVKGCTTKFLRHLKLDLLERIDNQNNQMSEELEDKRNHIIDTECSYHIADAVVSHYKQTLTPETVEQLEACEDAYTLPGAKEYVDKLGADSQANLDKLSDEESTELRTASGTFNTILHEKIGDSLLSSILQTMIKDLPKEMIDDLAAETMREIEPVFEDPLLQQIAVTEYQKYVEEYGNSPALRNEIRFEILGYLELCTRDAVTPSWLYPNILQHHLQNTILGNKQPGLMKAMQSFFWIPLTTASLMSQPPTTFATNHRKQAHSTAGPAIAWDTKIERYYLEGMRTPDWVITKPDALKVINTINNAELRRVAFDCIGWDDSLKALNAKIIDKNKDKKLGQLYELPNESYNLLIVQNASPHPGGHYETYGLPCSKDSQSAEEAQAAIAGLTVEQWRKIKVHT